MGDGVHVGGPVQDLQHPQVDAERPRLRGLQHDADLVRRHPDPADHPGAVHLQVRVDAGLPDPDEQVLAAAEHFVDDLTAEVDRRVPGHPDVAAGQLPALQRLAQFHGRAKDGVSLGHQRSRRPRGVREKPAVASASATADSRLSSTGTPSMRSTSSPEPVAVVTSSARTAAAALCGLGVGGEAQQRSATPFDEPGQLAVDEHHQRAGLAPGPVRACRPRRRGPARAAAAPYGLAGSVAASAMARRVVLFVVDAVGVGAQPVDGAGRRELGAPPSDSTKYPRWHRPASSSAGQHLVQQREPAGDVLGGHRALGQHAVAAQQLIGLEVRPHRRCPVRRSAAPTSVRPPSGRIAVRARLDVLDAVAAQPRRAAVPMRGGGRAALPGPAGARQQRPHRSEGVTGHHGPAQISCHSASLSDSVLTPSTESCRKK